MKRIVEPRTRTHRCEWGAQIEHKHLMGNYVGSLAEFTELMEYVRSGEKKDIPVETRPIEQVNSAVADLRSGDIIGRCVLIHSASESSL
jgi:D-arabinose 1-dehydrogenase-like Zn-dependent alcohol dehydrogenase